MRSTPLLFLLALAMLTACNDGSTKADTRTATPSTSATASPTATPEATATPETTDEPSFPELTPFAADLQATLHEIRDRVATIRGLPVHPTAGEGLTTTEALAVYGVDQFATLEEEDAAEAAAGEEALQLMGLMPFDYSYEDLISEQANIIAGVYYPQADMLALVGADPSNLTVSDELTIAHEYLHSIQDARWNIETLSDTWTESEQEEQGYTSYGETLSCLIEGDAEVTQRLYAEQFYGEDWQDIVYEEYAEKDSPDYDIPDFLLYAFYFNYSDCVTFVENLYERGGWEAVNAAYADPPGTQEQILDLSKYDAREWAQDPKPASTPPGWTVATDGQFGAYDVYNFVGSLTGDYFSGSLASVDWRSGWISVYESDGPGTETVVELTLAWDSAEQYDYFLEEVYPEIVDSYNAIPWTDGDGSRWGTANNPNQHGGLVVQPETNSVILLYGEDPESVEQFILSH